MGEMKTCTFYWKQRIFRTCVGLEKKRTSWGTEFETLARSSELKMVGLVNPLNTGRRQPWKAERGNTQTRKKKTKPGLFPRRVRRRNEWTACSAFCSCLHWLDDLSARQCVWRVARCPPWKLANEQQVEEKAGWVAWGSAGESPKWCVWWSLKGYWGLAAPNVSSAAFWGQAASLHWLYVKISNHLTAMVSVIGCRAKSQLPLILFFYCLSIHLEPLCLTT